MIDFTYITPSEVLLSDVGREIKRILATSRQGRHSSEAYAKLYSFLDLPPVASKIVSGELIPPFREEPIGRAFPPALLPLWSKSSGPIVGFWKHWFTRRRQMTIVKYHGTTIFNDCFMAFEWARNFEQLFYVEFFPDACDDQAIDDDIAEFCSKCGVGDISSILNFVDLGTVEECLLKHPLIRDDPPAALIQSPEDFKLYKGDFPCQFSSFYEQSMSEFCDIEIHSGFKNMKPSYELRKTVRKMPGAPAWLRGDSQPEVFENLMDREDLSGAWLSLNSTGWEIGKAREALRQLSQKASNVLFEALAEVWISQPFEPDDNY